jgi:hypothetical protein
MDSKREQDELADARVGRIALTADDHLSFFRVRMFPLSDPFLMIDIEDSAIVRLCFVPIGRQWIIEIFVHSSSESKNAASSMLIVSNVLMRTRRC